MSREMKDSGVKWIGEIPTDWGISRLKYVTNNLDSKRIPVEASQRIQSSSTLYPYYGANGIQDYVDSYLFDFPAVLVGEDGSVIQNDDTPYVNYAEGKYWVNNHAHIYTTKSSLALKYFYYLIGCANIKQLVTGSTMPKLTQYRAANINLPIPPLSVQKAISNYLDDKCKTIDAAIDKQKKIADNLKDYRQSVITDAVTKGLNPDVEMKECKLEWIDTIPANWFIIPLKRRYKSRLGKMLNSSEQTDRQLPYLRSANVQEYGFDLSDIKTMSFTEQEQDSYTIKDGDLVICEGGSVGVSQIWRGDDICIQNSLHRVRSMSGDSLEYLNYFINAARYSGYIDKISNAVSIAHFTKEKLDNLPIVLPPLQEQQQIVDYLDKKCSSIDAVISKSNSIIDKLEEYKKTLIYEYVTGKKEVPNSYK